MVRVALLAYEIGHGNNNSNSSNNNIGEEKETEDVSVRREDSKKDGDWSRRCTTSGRGKEPSLDS